MAINVSESGVTVIEAYEAVFSAVKSAQFQYDVKRTEILTSIKPELDALMLQVQPALDAEQEILDDKMAELKPIMERYQAILRETVIAKGETLKGKIVRCEFVKGSFKLKDATGLLGYAKEHPEVLKFFEETKPTTRVVELKV